MDHFVGILNDRNWNKWLFDHVSKKHSVNDVSSGLNGYGTRWDINLSQHSCCIILRL